MEKAPNVSEPLVGWRGWIINGPLEENDDHRLHSITQKQILWPDREPLKSRCGMSKIMIAKSNSLDIKKKNRCTFDEIPKKECWCGIHALHNLDILRLSGYNHVTTEKMEPHPYLNIYFSLRNYPIIGEVNLWGKMRVGRTGIRAQYAYPKNLFVRDEHKFLCDILYDLYGVPVYTAKDLKDSKSGYWRAS